MYYSYNDLFIVKYNYRNMNRSERKLQLMPCPKNIQWVLVLFPSFSKPSTVPLLNNSKMSVQTSISKDARLGETELGVTSRRPKVLAATSETTSKLSVESR